jgi:hypothetical protein
MIDLTKTRINDTGPKTDTESIVYGNKDGKIYFGYLHAGNIKCDSASAISGVHLQGFHSLHYITLLKNGPMQGSTIARCPGPFQIVSATEHAGQLGETEGVGAFIFAENGDIVIRAPRGRVRISGLDVDIRADGPDNTRGSINLDSNQSINLKTGSFDLTSTLGAKIFTPSSIDIVANTSLKFISNFTQGLTVASSKRPAKGVAGLQTKDTYNNNQNY